MNRRVLVLALPLLVVACGSDGASGGSTGGSNGQAGPGPGDGGHPGSGGMASAGAGGAASTGSADSGRSGGDVTGTGGAVTGGAAGMGGSPATDGGYIAPSPAEWVQEAHDAQRTGYTPIEPAKPWAFKWFWAPPVEVHESTMARGVHAVTGGNHVYMPAGNQGLFALKKTDGSVGWSKTNTAFDAAGAYDGSNFYIGGEDGQLYKLDAATGSLNGSFNAASPIKTAVLLVGDFVYVTSEAGKLFKVNKQTMVSAWAAPYDAGSGATTPPTYSASRDVVIFGTKDLNVHAVRNDTGAAKWKKNPTPFSTTNCTPYSFDYVWPVVAEAPGVVFVRFRLGDQSTWLWGPGTNGKYPSTNAELRAYLDGKPEIQALYALNLDDGTKKFIPAVGNGGVDAFWQDCSNAWVFRSTVGPMPAVRTLDGGKQVAYIVWRNGQRPDVDGRWDSHLGEMVLDANTVPGYAAGDLRFVQADASQSKITDEASPLTFAGNTLFFAHWGASESFTLTDRSNTKGDVMTNPILSTRNHAIIRRVMATGTQDVATHFINGGASFYQDGRGYDGGSWWVYWNRWDPPIDNHDNTGYQDNHYPNRPRYTIVSDGLILVIGNGGDVFALSHQ